MHFSNQNALTKLPPRALKESTYLVKTIEYAPRCLKTKTKTKAKKQNKTKNKTKQKQKTTKTNKKTRTKI